MQPRPVMDGYLGHARPFHLHQSGKEAVHAGKHGNALDVLGTARPERAADVGHRIMGSPVADSVGDAGRNSPHPGIATVGAHAADDVVDVQALEQTGDVGRIVLEICVEGDDDAAAGEAEAGLERRRLTGVAPLADHAHGGILAGQPSQDLGAAIGAAVVDEEGFIRTACRLHGALNFSREERKALLFVVDRDDDGDLGQGHGSILVEPRFLSLPLRYAAMESGPASRTVQIWPAIVAVWALLAGLPLALRPLIPIDETRYASVAWEMWTRGDFLVPHLNGLPYSDKPPLLFWLLHLGWWVFGVNEWWPRLVPALCSLTNLFLARALALRLWPDRPAVARGVPAVLLGFLLWSFFTGMLMFDMLVALCVLLGLLGLHEAWARGGALAWVQVGAALGLGALAKGPVILVAPLIVAALAPWWGGRKAGWKWWLGLAGALAVAHVVALSWALPAAHAGGMAYGEAILFSQTEERVVHSFAHLRPWWWYLPLLPVILFPYSVWQPLWRSALRLRTLDSGMRFCLAWTLPSLVVFSLISGKQPHYLLPLLPGFALLATRLLDEPGAAPRRLAGAAPLAGLLIVAGALSAAPFLVLELDLPQWVEQVSPFAGAMLALAAAVGFLAFDRIFGRRAEAPVLFTLLVVTALYIGCAGAIGRYYDMKPIARYLALAERQGRPIGVVGLYHGQFHFLGRLERPFAEVPAGAEWQWLARHPGGKLVQSLRDVPSGVIRPDFSQPYRTEFLAVWSREPTSPLPSS
jgi:4-amino-4-deoxy-L-arabinose transferase-like glycosyltransferase